MHTVSRACFLSFCGSLCEYFFLNTFKIIICILVYLKLFNQHLIACLMFLHYIRKGIIPDLIGHNLNTLCLSIHHRGVCMHACIQVCDMRSNLPATNSWWWNPLRQRTGAQGQRYEKEREKLTSVRLGSTLQPICWNCSTYCDLDKEKKLRSYR